LGVLRGRLIFGGVEGGVRRRHRAESEIRIPGPLVIDFIVD
jgi:hypothetical protein